MRTTPSGKMSIEHNSEHRVIAHAETAIIELMYDIFSKPAEPGVPNAETAELET
jgi:hypothetical protein